MAVDCPAETREVGIKYGGGCWREDGLKLEPESWAILGAVQQQRPSAMKVMQLDGARDGRMERMTVCQRRA